MKYGMNMLLWTDDCTGRKFPPLFERLKGMGYDSVEIPILSVHDRKLRALATTLDGLGLERTGATCLTPERNLISPERRLRAAGVAHLRSVIDACQAMGIKLLIGPFYAALGVFSGRPPTAREWAWAVEGLQEVSEHARRAGVTLAAEYLNRFEIYLLNCAEDAARLVRDVGHPNFRMMYDTFHAHIEEKSISSALEACKDVVVHVHVSENDRSTPGKGGVDWRETWKNLKRLRYGGMLVVEAFGQGLPGLAAATKIWRRMFDDEETLAVEALAFMKRSWEGP
ncbi:MAG TPA: sugar phosphate isomerase/epimerase [Planctomycetota bacterium]|nr:sugar phosphate isomerase/epimerase [Planctomycetota bacterium]